MRVAIVGSREFPDRELVESIIQQLIVDYKNIILVSGGARGVDSWAEEVFHRYNKMVIVHYPDWNKYGKKAGFLRNKLIINDANMIIAFWDGKSKGTKHSINLAIEAGKPINIYMRQ
ncbi:MAG: SLOG family protein [Candidatus Thorarchaeota archaeon]|jgi:hypothetical protein